MTSRTGFLCRSAASACGALLALSALSAAPAHAQGTFDTLKRIVDTGTISLGHRESSVPFSYYDNRKQVIGYSHELMLRVTDAIKSELGLSSLTLRLVPVTAQNRIPLVQNGSVDLECGSTSHNAERERQVSFSVSIFVIGTRLMTRRDSGIRDFPDLAGRKVVVTSGTTSERLLRTYNERLTEKFTIIQARDHGESFQLLEASGADAFMMDDALLYGERAKAQHPEDWVVVGTPMSSEVYGCMMRLEDRALKAIVDRALTRIMRSGEAMKIYTKWFQRPIPPRGLNLNWPPSDALLQLYRSPVDHPLG
ncbi:transporter substrate-binding domain-containing protein [Piscinibacter koreensis]|uniref:Transporter substrate-binding domain-containing protein n=1 Tax=Piscinibacter koreensis TaxID=2742824 RepID=A0A7Y6NJN4_9BURK|nr:transporter substrate-binding domain-containing protein [Schlegelella koreensis]NUZ04420.1 transporter substrate-binding domain-containing protein [Schlegelella koreensis]